MNNTEKIISELTQLSQEPGFIYTYCTMVHDNLCVSGSEISNINWYERLNGKELSFLLGLMVKNQIIPVGHGNNDSLERQRSTAVDLLHKLHTSIMESMLGNIANPQTTKVDPTALSQDSQGIVEAIFYDAPGAFDFQWLELAPKRYCYDEEWFKRTLGFNLQEMVNVASEIRTVVTAQLNDVRVHKDILEVFCVEPSQLSSESEAVVTQFFKIFSCRPGEVNCNFQHVNDINEAEIKPLIRIGGRYFLPSHTWLFQSIYESPFYWMLNDSQYKDQALDNRGLAGEDVVYDLLHVLNHGARIYRGVTIWSGKQKKAEIDVLFVFKHKAIVVQVKSKKLTALAKSGDMKTLKDDFQKACQDAYCQGLRCRHLILAGNSMKLLDREEKQVQLPHMDDIYVLCVTGDYYPGLHAQQRALLDRVVGNPYPLIVSVFDLEVVCILLGGPIDLLYYIRQRTVLEDRFDANSELELLASHLQCPLREYSGVDVVIADPQDANVVDLLFPARKGYPLPGTDIDAIHKSYWSEEVLALHEEVKKVDGPYVADAMFMILNLSSGLANEVIKMLAALRKQTLTDGRIHDCSFVCGLGAAGFTLISVPHKISNAEAKAVCMRLAHIHRQDAKEWLGLISIQPSTSVVDGYWWANKDSRTVRVEIRNLFG